MQTDLGASTTEEIAANSIDRVDSNVFIGGYLAAADAALIRRLGITRIVKMFADDGSYQGGSHRHPGVAYLVIPAEDAPSYDIRPGAVEAVRFIRQGIARCERVLVHCHMGISRSATVVLFHLMVNRAMPLDLALPRLRLVRAYVRPNAGFMEHLRATDARLRRLRVGDEEKYVAPPPVLGEEGASPAAQLWGYAPARRDAEALDGSLLLRLARDGRGHAGGRDGAVDADFTLPPEVPWTFTERSDVGWPA